MSGGTGWGLEQKHTNLCIDPLDEADDEGMHDGKSESSEGAQVKSDCDSSDLDMHDISEYEP